MELTVGWEARKPTGSRLHGGGGKVKVVLEGLLRECLASQLSPEESLGTRKMGRRMSVLNQARPGRGRYRVVWDRV
jgi:hypothetical protein